MATTATEVEGLLKELEMQYTVVNPTLIRVGFDTETYCNPSGVKSFGIFIDILEEGEFFNFVVPQAFSVPEASRGAFNLASLIIQWRTKMLQFELDHTDGEVRMVVELPIEDAKMTARQLRRVIYALVQFGESFYDVLSKAASTGTFDPADLDKPAPAAPIDVGGLATGMFNALPPEHRAGVFAALPEAQRVELFRSLPAAGQLDLLRGLPEEQRAALAALLPAEELKRLITAM